MDAVSEGQNPGYQESSRVAAREPQDAMLQSQALECQGPNPQMGCETPSVAGG